MDIQISALAAQTLPTLATWISAAGMACAIGTPAERAFKAAPRILHASETELAGPKDILIDFRDGPPEFIWSSGGHPARISFGFDDMAFGHAMTTELVRPANRPACGEPTSAELLRLAARVGSSDATVLILGETGTGKEGLSRFVHAASSRAGKPFVAVNCAALPETMLEAILFGHQKGSFTGAGQASEGLFRAAEGGTLLLDEVAELPLALQAKLLRALQEKEILPVGATQPIAVDVRIIAAANRDLAAEVAAGRFRADLYWRLNVLPLSLRPLRERRQDVRAITAALLIRHADHGQSFPWPTASALERLMGHVWPGNVRELENVLQRALLLREGEGLEAADLAIEAATPAADLLVAEMVQAAPTLSAPAMVIPADTRFSRIGRASQVQAIASALEETGGHRARAAERLGISERTLRYRLAELRAAA